MSTENEIKTVALQLINNLTEKEVKSIQNENDLFEQFIISKRINIAKIALISPQSLLGTCEECGKNLHFETKNGVLYICCSGSPGHCWRQ